MEKLYEILKDVFEFEEIDDAMSYETSEEWDSFTHMNLIVSLEEKYSLRFTKEEIVEMLDITTIIMVLKRKGIKFD